MCWFPFFKSSKRRKKPSNRKEQRSEKDSYHNGGDYPGGSPKVQRAQTAPYGTFVAKPPVRSQKPRLKVDVPERVERPVRDLEESSSTEMLLNPRPERSRQHRQRHHRSTTTLRGRGAKRDPPSKSSKRTPPGKSKKMPSSKSARKEEYLRVPSPSQTPTRRHRVYQSSSSQQNQRSPVVTQARAQAPTYQQQYQNAQQYYQNYYQQHHQPSTSHSAQYSYQRRPARSSSRQPAQHTSRSQSRNPNTAVRRAPDGRFAVRAATNQALESIRQEAFRASPQQQWTYHGVPVTTAETPFHWDCVSSSGSGSVRPARPRRRY